MERRRLDSLTSLRWFAAFGVFAYHATARFGQHSWAVPAFGLGYTGVSFFFVLSGFVLAWSQPEGQPARRFWRNRFARVWPLHAATWLIVVVTGLGVVTPMGGVAGLVLLQSWSPNSYVYWGGNASAWTLSCEALFYLCFPVVVLGARRVVARRNVRAVLICTVMAPMLWNWWCYLRLPAQGITFAAQVIPLSRLTEFITGVLLGVSMRSGWRPRLRPALAVAALAVTSATLIACGRVTLDYPGQVVNTALLLPAVVAVIVAFASWDADARLRFLRRRPLVTLGEWSFAFYLVHAPVLTLVERIARGWVGVCFSAGLATAVAGLAHTWVERPIERWIRLGRKRPQPVSTLATIAAAGRSYTNAVRRGAGWKPSRTVGPRDTPGSDSAPGAATEPL